MDAVAQLFEAWMPSSVPQMVLLTFVETKVRPAAGSGTTNQHKQGVVTNQTLALRQAQCERMI